MKFHIIDDASVILRETERSQHRNKHIAFEKLRTTLDALRAKESGQ